MRLRLVVAICGLSALLCGQNTPASCPANRPVDEVIAAIQKQQSKKAARNKSLLPENMCFAGWCRQAAKTPPIVASDGAPAASSPAAGTTSSSRAAIGPCDEAMEKTLAAAHDTEVGDYYFDENNFKAASFRYEDALKNKPNDAAIHVRLGRAFERLKEGVRAVEHYQAAINLGEPSKYVAEAKAALDHLSH